MIIYMPVSLFEHRPEQCPFGHSVAPGMPQRVGWMPCICAPAREAAERGRGMGHLWILCDTCHVEHWQTTFYEPPHDIRHDRTQPLVGPGPWPASRCRQKPAPCTTRQLSGPDEARRETQRRLGGPACTAQRSRLEPYSDREILGTLSRRFRQVLPLGARQQDGHVPDGDHARRDRERPEQRRPSHGHAQ